MSRARLVNPVWALALFVAALILLLRALDVLPDGVFDVLSRAWPALLVLGGLMFLLRSRVPLSGLLSLVISAGLVAVVAFVAYGDQASQVREDYRQEVVQTVGGDVTLLVINVESQATEVDIRAATDESEAQISGQFTGSKSSELSVDYVEDDQGRGTLTLTETQRPGFPALDAVGRGRLRLVVPATVPVAVAFAGEDGDVLLDMSGLQLERLSVEVANGDVALTLPAYAPQSPNAIDQPGIIEARNGQITLFVPEAVAARLELNRQGSGIEPEFDDAVYRYLQGDVLEARGFEDEANDAVKLRYILTAPSGVIRVETVNDT